MLLLSERSPMWTKSLAPRTCLSWKMWSMRPVACKKLILTVPYGRKSRLGLHHLREGLRKPVSAESVHLLELCPEDMRLLFAHTGRRVARERIYLQYPRRSPLALTRPLWARWDFEDFYGAVLEPDDAWSSLYGSWS